MSVVAVVVLSMLLAARAEAAIRYGGDRTVFTSRATDGIRATGPVLAVSPDDRAAIAWLATDRIYLVIADRRRVSAPVAMPVPEGAPGEFDRLSLAVDVNDRGDVAVAFSLFTGSDGSSHEPGNPCCADAWVMIRRVGAKRFGPPQEIVRAVKSNDGAYAGVKLSPVGRVAVWYGDALRYTLGRRSRHFTEGPDGCSASFDLQNRMIAVCTGGRQASSTLGHPLGPFDDPLGGRLGPYGGAVVRTDRRGRQIALWNERRDDGSREAFATWRRPGDPFGASRDLGPTDWIYGPSYAMAPDGSGAVVHTIRGVPNSSVMALPVDTSGRVGTPLTLATGEHVDTQSVAVDRGGALVAWSDGGLDNLNTVSRFRLINLNGSPTPPARAVAPRYASPVLGLTRSFGLAAWSEANAHATEIHLRRIFR